MIPYDGMSLQYLKAALRRRFWHVVVTFFVIFMATLLYCIIAPKVYRSSTLILVQPQEVPADFVRPTVTSDATSRLNTLKEQIMSRPRLEELIKKYDLYPKVHAAGTMYDAVETMRKHITLEVKETRGRRDTAPAAFEVSYEGREPATARDVTAAIANLFIEDDLRLRERLTAGTSRFLEKELERMREELRKKEELVRQFKEENMGRLPEQMENNYRILAQLQQHLDSVNQTLQQTEDRKVVLQGQSSRIEALRSGTIHSGGEQGGTTVNYSLLSLDELREQLEDLRSHYSDKHPDVVRLNAKVLRLEKDQHSAASTRTGSESAVIRPGASRAQQFMVAQREDLITQLKLTDKEIQNLIKEKRQASRQIEEYRQRIETGPRIEQMFLDLRRDYEEASENYQSLLEKKLQAKLAENLERTQKGEQFIVLEPANLPLKPSKPKVLKILALGFIFALVCGLGLGYLREYLDPTFWSSKHLENVLELPVLVSVPVVDTTKERRWRLLKRAGTVSAVISMACVLLYALFVLWKIDPTAFPFPAG